MTIYHGTTNWERERWAKVTWQSGYVEPLEEQIVAPIPQYDTPIGPQTRLGALGIVRPKIEIDTLINQRLARRGRKLAVDPLSLEEGLIEAEIEEPIDVTVASSFKNDVGMILHESGGTLAPKVELDLGAKADDMHYASSELNHFFWLGMLLSNSLASDESRQLISETRQKRIDRANWRYIGGLVVLSANNIQSTIADRPNAVAAITGILIVATLWGSRSSTRKTSLQDIADKLHRNKAEELAKKHPVFGIDTQE